MPVEGLVFCPEHRSAWDHVACAEKSHPGSRDGLEVAPAPENRPVLQNLLLPWLCSSWLVPVEFLLGGAQAAAPPPWQETRGKARQTGGCFAPRGRGGVPRGAGCTPGSAGSRRGTWAQDTRLQQKDSPGRRPCNLAEPPLGQKEVAPSFVRMLTAQERYRNRIPPEQTRAARCTL